MREENQDAIFADGSVFQENLRDVITMRLSGTPQALAVADGIGGRPQGALASRSALQFLGSDARLVRSEAACEEALHAANEHLYGLMREPTCLGMGTTIAGFVVQERAVLSFNVGDSRGYRFSRGCLVRVSQDDVPMAVDRRADRPRGITQCLGGSEFPLGIMPHVFAGPPFEVGECLMLCTDGLTEALDDSELAMLFRELAHPAAMVEKLVRQGISRGSRDNISVLVSVAVA
ncbi:hypothetical protein XH88_26240 [Bradyrhizobium sp. CCBAU 51627]|nr:hypothetical protein [Bradyrhizobium sp. CCBAU 51627]